MRRNLIRTAGISMITAGLCAPAIVLAVSPAAATTPLDCDYVVVSDLGKITTAGGGTVSFAASNDGVLMSTPAQASKVTYRNTIGAAVLLSKVTTLTYVTDRQAGATGVDSTVAAYKLGVDATGDGSVDGILVYEPYYNGTVTDDQETHNALGTDRSGKWWYSAEPGNKQTLATMKDWIEGRGPVAFSAPKVAWFGVEQGTYNTGAITLVTNVRFKADDACTNVRFAAKMPTKPVPTKSSFPPPPTKPVPTKSSFPPPPMKPVPTTATSSFPPPRKPVATTKPATTAPTTTPPVAGGGGGADPTGGGLPLTGPATVVTGGVGLGAIAVGGFLLVITRRRTASGSVA
jgi:hypothetical protein